MRNVQRGTAKGLVRMYSEASQLAVIDASIRALVDAMNVGGIVETRSSCAGHRWPLLAALQAPFVMFKADCRYASRLSAAIHKDCFAAIHYLHYDWDITARFDVTGEFIFMLECRSRRFRRSRLERDFQTLKSWAEEIFRSRDLSDTHAPILSASQGKQGAA